MQTCHSRKFASIKNVILLGKDLALDAPRTENDLDMKGEVEEWKLQRMAKVHAFLELWQCPLNLLATKKESSSQNKRMIAIGYISDTEEIIKASWSKF